MNKYSVLSCWGRRKRAICLLILISVFFFLAASLFAEDYYVRQGASGKGTKNNPYGYLWKALAKALRGDVIHVAAGAYNGKGGSGAFVIKVPDLTLTGGYNEDFSKRDPFKDLTILERAENYRGDWTGLPEGIVAGDQHADHSGLILDGFVLNAESRNAYFPNKINPKKSYHGMIFQSNSANIKIRNCILLNPYGNGIYSTWQGEENEITNSFILNTFYAAISTRSAQPNSVIRIKNCTVAFVWFQPGKGGGIGVFVGRQGKTILENNIFALIQTEGGESGFGVSNTFGNDETEMKNNIFFQCQGGYYKYMDENKQSLVVWESDELEEIEDDPELYMLWEAEGNNDTDPGMMPDKDYFRKFANTVASQPGKLNMDVMNEWRRSVGLPLQAEDGTARDNWGMAYPLAKVASNLVSKPGNAGVQANGPFESYRSAGAEAESKDYAEVAFDSFIKGGSGVKSLAGKPVMFKAGLGPNKTTWFIPSAPRSDYKCVMLLLPGESDYTRKYLFGYILKGSEADKSWEKYYKKRDRYNSEGLIICGTAWYAGNDNYAYPVGIIVDSVKRK